MHMVTDFRELAARVKERIDIVEFLRNRGLDVKRSGTRYWALCPFHTEDTPSFSIDGNTGRYYCFGCRESGDIFTYMQKTEGLSFKEALEEECKETGVEFKQSDEEVEEGRRRKTYMEIAAETWRFFREQYDALPEDHIAKAHEIREKRNISSYAKDNHYLFGWAPASRTMLISRLEDKGFSLEDMIGAGVVNASRDENGRPYCPWSERLMFPICDMVGRPVGFSGRIVHYDTAPDASKPKRKYVNSRDSEIYHKGELLFCQHIARRQASREHLVYVVEGQFDVIAMQTADHDNTVASSGTAVSVKQARSLQRMVGGEGRIVFMFDADHAGQDASIRTFKELGSLQSQAWACVTDGKDPADMVADGGTDSLNAQLGTTTELWRHVLETLKSRNDLSTPDGNIAFLNEFKDVWLTISDPVISESAVKLASLWSGVGITSLQSRLGGRPRADNANAVNTSSIPERNAGATMAVDGFTFTVDPEMGLNASALAEPGQRFVLEHVKMRGVNEKFRTWLLKASNGGVDRPAFDLNSGMEYKPEQAIVATDGIRSKQGRAYVEALYRLNDDAHRFDLAASMATNTAELTAQQLHVYVKWKALEDRRATLSALRGTGTGTDRAQLEEYDSTVRKRMSEVSHRESEMNRELEPVFSMLERIGERQAEENVTIRDSQSTEYVDSTVKGIRRFLEPIDVDDDASHNESTDAPSQSDGSHADTSMPTTGTTGGPAHDDSMGPVSYDHDALRDDDALMNDGIPESIINGYVPPLDAPVEDDMYGEEYWGRYE